MRLAKATRQRILLSWHSNTVNMVVHQTPSPDVHAMAMAGPAQVGKVGSAVFGAEEDIHAPVTTLNYVMGIAGDYNSR